MLLKDMLKGVDYSLSGGSVDTDIMGVTDDSRTVYSGSLFVAVSGYFKDGRRFVSDAVSRGAAAIISDRGLQIPDGVIKIFVTDVRAALSSIAVNFYDDPSNKLKLIGITGTNGKTTVTYLVEAIAKRSGLKTGVIGTINHRIDGKARPAKNTTPGVLELQSLLSEMASSGVRCAVMEVSSHALDQGRVLGVNFDAAVFTNITSDHLDYHKTREEYFKAKSKIFAHMKKSGVAFLNNDDERVRSLEGSIGVRTVTYGTGDGSAVRAFNIRLLPEGSYFDVETPSGRLNIKTGLIGMHNVSNCLAAISVMQALGVNGEAIVDGIEGMKSVPGRLEPVDCGQPFKVLVDYAHTEDALDNVLSMLKSIAGKNILTVFGCGGDRDKSKRPFMGQAACRYSDRVIVTSDNPRSEEPLDIIRDIESGIKGRFSNYEIDPDRRSAIRKAVLSAEAGDIVLIAGKGHEDYQILKDRVMHFDDREVAREALSDIGVRCRAQEKE